MLGLGYQMLLEKQKKQEIYAKNLYKKLLVYNKLHNNINSVINNILV